MKSRVQAEKKYKEAKQYITTGLFNWSKDYSAAATSFQDAFKLYKEAGAWEECLKTLKQLLICNDKLKDMWAIGRNQESMLNIYLDGHVKIPNKQLSVLTQQAFCQFRMANSTDNGLKLAGRVAKFLIANGDRNEGLQLLKMCYKESLDQEKSYSKDGTFDVLVSTMLDNNMLEEAIVLFKEKIEREKDTNKCIQMVALTYIVLLLLNRDIKQAEMENTELMGLIPSYLSSSECEAACNLLQYYNEGNVAKFTKQSSRAVVNSIFPIIILKKLREFKLPAMPQAPTADQPKPEGKSAQEQQMMKQLFY